MKCDGCGKFFIEGNRPDGTPNGVGFMTQTGTLITVCADCLIRVGMMGKDARKAFLDELERKASGEVQ